MRCDAATMLVNCYAVELFAIDVMFLPPTSFALKYFTGEWTGVFSEGGVGAEKRGR